MRNQIISQENYQIEGNDMPKCPIYFEDHSFGGIVSQIENLINYDYYRFKLLKNSYHTKASTSPPTLRRLASLSVTTPLLVEIMAIPSPPSTLGSSSLLA